jgi:hypothetical protein
MRKHFFGVVFILSLLLAGRLFAASTVTKTVCPSGCDYTTVNAAASYFETNYSNFVTSDIVGEIVIQGDWTSSPDTTAVNISLITTDATRYLSIYTTGTARHDGFYGNKASAYRLETSGVSSFVVDDVRNVRVDGLQIKMTSTVANTQALYFKQFGAGEQRASNNIVVGVLSGSAGNTYGLVQEATNASSLFKAWNNIVYDIKNGAVSTLRGLAKIGTNGTAYFYNNTVYGNYVGLFNSGGGRASLILAAGRYTPITTGWPRTPPPSREQLVVKRAIQRPLQPS